MLCPRPVVAALLLGVGFSIAGCAQGQDVMDSVQNTVHDFNPFGTAKRPLPGTRRAMFPEGVPGVQQGVPSELVRGAQPPQVAATPEPTAQPEQPRARTRRVRTTATSPAPQRRERPQRARRTAPAADDPPADGVWPPPPPQASRAAPAAAPAARPAPAAPSPAAQPSWSAPPSAPVPTVWPDPPKAQ